MMKQISVLCSALAFVSCSTEAVPWKHDGLPETRVLPNVTVARGGHCESSAIMNALRHEGYDVSECMVTGGGGALSFMFQKGTFPFLGARNEDMRERFFSAAGIAWHIEIPEGKDTGWNTIDSLLARDVPVILRVDMRFLPYRYNGKYGSPYMSFGGHYITLFGIDYKRRIAFVSDTEFEGLQTVKLGDLEKARTSKTKVFPPRAEYYWIDPPSARTGAPAPSLDPDELVRSSLDGVLRNYESGALAGLARYGADLAALETYSTKRFLLPAVLEYMAGNIEDFGTGGASFRVLYRSFLVYAGERSSFKETASLVPLIDESIASWHELSSAMRETAKKINRLSAPERAEAFAKLGKIADQLYIREKTFYTEIRRIRQEEK